MCEYSGIDISFSTTLDVDHIHPTWDIYKFPPTVIPKTLTFNNYVYVVTQMEGFGRYFLNSVVVTSLTIIIVVISSAMGGYAFGMQKFKGQNLLFMGVISVLTIPYIMHLYPYTSRKTSLDYATLGGV